jgi:predicted component of type VI protein secretion system
MANQNQKTETPSATIASSSASSLARTERGGLLPGVVHLALDVADRGQATAIAILQDARIELRGAVEGGVDLAEKVAAALFRVARKSIQRVDEASAETLTGVGQVLAGAVKSARETTRAAAELATAASSGVTGVATASA